MASLDCLGGSTYKNVEWQHAAPLPGRQQCVVYVRFECMACVHLGLYSVNTLVDCSHFFVGSWWQGAMDALFQTLCFSLNCL